MRSVTGMMGLQKASSLLGVHGDSMVDSGSSDSRARARRSIMTPQREYPIFTPGFREPAVLPSSSEQSRTSFQDSDGQSIWKEIHTDTIGDSSHSLSFETGHILSPSVSATSLDGPSMFLKPSSRNHSPRPEYLEAPPLLSPSPPAMLPQGRKAINNGSNFYSSVPSTPAPRTYAVPNRQRGGSPSMAAVIPHSPQNINILSPQLRPLEKSPKLTQIHIASPRMTENGGLTPMVNQLTLSPDQARPAFVIDTNDPQFSSSSMLPPASVARSPQQMGMCSSGGQAASTLKLKKVMKQRNGVENSPRPSVSKDRSPGRAWKKSFRVANSPALTSIRDESPQAQNGARGIAREVNSSLHGSKGRANGGANCVISSAVPSWRGCGDGGQAMVAPILDRDQISQEIEFSGEFMGPDAANRVGGKKVASTQKSGSYNIFNFLSWGKKKPNGAGTATPTPPGMKMAMTESFQSDMGSVTADSESIKVLDYTIKTLRYKLEQANQKRASAVEEVRVLQSALETSDEKCRLLTQRCQELELQLSARRSGIWDMDLDTDTSPSSGYYNPNPNRRDSSNNNNNNTTTTADPGPPRRFSSQELTPEQFLKIFEDSKTSIRKLASSICHQIREGGESATQVITSLLEQHKVGRSVSRMPRNVIILYFESFLNQVMFESFENVSFEPNGASSVFDPDTLKQTCYRSFQHLKSQEWGSIEKSLGKPGALVVNANFHRFFVVRMELILSQLGKLAENEVSLALMAAFFNAVKSVWLVHHLAFAFDQPVSIFRVSPSAEFDSRFMEIVTAFEDEPARSKIGIMINPGFIVNHHTIKCQVYCSSTYQ